MHLLKETDARKKVEAVQNDFFKFNCCLYPNP